MADEHGLHLTEGQLSDIWHLVQTEITSQRNGALLDALISQAKATEVEYLTRIERTFDVKPQGYTWQRFLTPEARAVLVAGGRITNEQ